MTDEEKLADAKKQYHLLVSGQQARVFVDQNGERVEFTAANRGALLAYIHGLEARVNKRPNGPMQVFF